MIAAAFPLVIAFGTGGLLTFMVLLNGTLAAHGGAVFSSWVAHGTGTLAALCALILLRRRGRTQSTIFAKDPVPLWAYLGGVSGAATVILTSTTMNTVLALSGTLALGLAGQVGFSLFADRFGLFGLPAHKLTTHGLLSLALIAAGAALIIFGGTG